MARNKHPEETIEKILTVSRKLFNERGYEHTTIADIVAGTGMSKGAFYHHFKSKEEVYDHLSDRYYAQMDWMESPTKLPGKNALEKIKYLFSFLLSDQEKLDLDRLGGGNTDVIARNPKMVWLTLVSSVHEAAPVLIPLIEEGNADGSLHVAQPKETSEALMILMNMWVGVFIGDKADFMTKMTFLKSFSDALGLPMIDEQVLTVADAYYDKVITYFKPLS